MSQIVADNKSEIDLATKNRQYERWQISADPNKTELILNRRRYPARLVEISIGGFAVIVPGSLKIAKGEFGQLRAPQLNFIVSVTRVEIRPEGAFVGLKQVEEILDFPGSSSRGNSAAACCWIGAIASVLVAVVACLFMHGT